MLDVNDTALQGKTGSDKNEKGFAKIEMLLEATGGLSLSQVCTVTGLEGSTIQNWVKRGWVENPVGKKYEEVHLARILIINALKECIKLEHITMLMSYVNGKAKDGSEAIIKESTLYNYLCEAMKQSGQSDDNSKGGVESVVDNVIKDYKDPNPDSRIRIRKALTLMMFACVCTDVKRRTEAMMGAIIKELDEPRTPGTLVKPAAQKPVAAPPPAAPVVEPAPEPVKPQVVTPIRITIDEPDEPDETIEDVIETRKTVSQALREWDISSVEKIIIDHDEEARNNVGVEVEDKKPVNRPWYVRKNPK
ncbi:MAG: DUF1836 domain-containing protein [Oscillospiraceae bacterium]|nr:DUF1836 domain-containing protein [Oscillospiraceae bacterium]